ncbi:lantibiotic dehydratase [Streptomyces sp. I05A-00742]|uniref:lantibiotic dehydratase n=1 Tax=Streptomyces sp. I05A-00742 TaxID=2732853 RepID=UPI0014888171|nr:lantibiotic dehydratase [Streptomyces sp. I05A-00742]
MTAPHPRWLFHDHAVIRSTGFPWNLLDVLEHPLTVARVRDVERAEDTLADAVTAVVDAGRRHPHALAPRDSRRLRTALSRRAPLPADLPAPDPPGLRAALARYGWAHEAARSAEATARHTLETETAARHAALVELAGDPAVREALWLSSPTMHDRGLAELAGLAHRPATGRARRLRRQFGGYVQRLAAKNETTSFFGPITYADFTEPPADHPPPTTGPPAARRTHLAHWAVLLLADAMAADPRVRPFLRPRRDARLARTADGTWRIAGRPLDLDAGLTAVLDAADGRTTCAELAAAARARAESPGADRAVPCPTERGHSETEAATARRAGPPGSGTAGEGATEAGSPTEGSAGPAGGRSVGGDVAGRAEVQAVSRETAARETAGEETTGAGEAGFPAERAPGRSGSVDTSPACVGVPGVGRETTARRQAVDAPGPTPMDGSDGITTSHPPADLTRAAPALVPPAVEEAVRRGLLRLDCHPPITAVDALGRLREDIAALPAACPARDEWRRRADGLHEAVAAFNRAGLERRRELLEGIEAELGRITTGPLRRGGGQWYADRTVLHEECLGPCSPLPLGGRLHGALAERLAPALSLLAAEAVARHRALTAAFLARHPELADGREVPLLRLLRADARAEPLAVPRTRTPAGAALEALVAAAPPDRPLVVDPRLLPELDLGDDPLIASPDVMIPTGDIGRVRAGDALFVLAECHDTLLLWGWALQFHPDADGVRARGAELLRRAAGGRVLAGVLGSRRAKIVPFDFPGPLVDVGSGPVPDDRRIPVGAVVVRLDGGRLVCAAPGTGGVFLLHHGELDSPVHNVLAPPKVNPVVFGEGVRLPRIVLGDVVVQRARWTLPTTEFFPPGTKDAPPDPYTALRAARHAARRHGLPRRTFLKVPGERKPVLLDLDAPALLDLGAHLARAADRVVLTELLPGPDELWLAGPTGRHCAELRTTAVLDRGEEGTSR